MNLQLQGKRALVTGSSSEDRATIERRFTRERIPLCVSRLGRPADIGNMVAFLASPLADYVSGANFRVDGGQCRSVN